MGSPAPGINLSVVRGTIVDEPHRRELPSGGVAVQFDIAVIGDDGTQRVPVSWVDPPPGADAVLAAQIEVVVVGEVRRRFFRVGGNTQSRTEVVVQQLVPCRRRAAARKAVASAIELLVPDTGAS